MSHNVSKASAEKPLLGAVICCTSISPEERSILADHAQQMGAEHKLDLTSDVTHLLVGATNTPKYQYVAREREDVKVLRPEWMQAVRKCWMEDRFMDMNAIEAQYRVPTLAGLKICITGFDELSFRAELAGSVKGHGGEYTGDLTKDVTHLIACEPVGKKYEYATMWQKKVVGLKWLQDTLARGMQLDESTYHPSMHPGQQGLGAWNRQRVKLSLLGKRGGEVIVQGPIRKIRRTASSKFGGQTDNIWGDIVSGRNQIDSADHGRDVLRPSKSMPVLPNAAIQIKPETDTDSTTAKTKPFHSNRDGKCLEGLRFHSDRFDSRQKSIIDETLTTMGAHSFAALTDLLTQKDMNESNTFIIVPHQSKRSHLPYLGKASIKPNIVTELWLERCMIEKSLIPPEQYPLGGLIEEIGSADVATLSLNATGFQSIETLHISKCAEVIGARYDEGFTAATSVLVCNSKQINHAKIAHAQQWKVPVVSEKWLWKLLQSGTVPDFQHYPLNRHEDTEDELNAQFKRNRVQSRDTKTMLAQQVQAVSAQVGNLANQDKLGDPDVRVSKEDPVRTGNESKLSGSSRHGRAKLNGVSGSSEVSSRTDRTSTHRALKEVSPNSPTESLGSQDQHAKVSQLKCFDGANERANGHSQINAETSDAMDKAPRKASMSSTNAYNDTETTNSIVQDFLNLKARAKAAAQKSEPDGSTRNKKRLFGRALSNLSNSSRTSNPRQSRASSIDSLNTDGVGSELPPPSASDGRTGIQEGRTRHNSFNLVGRAQAQLKSSLAHLVTDSIDLSDPNLCRDELDETELGPQLTQLGYEDSEEVIALRERLAEKKRARRNPGQMGDEPNAEASRQLRDTTKKRVIKDDETVLALESKAGWGAGRRTRQRDKEAAKGETF